MQLISIWALFKHLFMYLVVAIIASCPRRGGAGNGQSSGMHEFLNLKNFVLNKEMWSLNFGRQVGDRGSNGCLLDLITLFFVFPRSRFVFTGSNDRFGAVGISTAMITIFTEEAVSYYGLLLRLVLYYFDFYSCKTLAKAFSVLLKIRTFRPRYIS